MPKNHTVVGWPGFEQKNHSLYCPHNYKVYVEFSRKTFSLKKTDHPPNPGFTVQRKNHGKEIEIRNYWGTRLRIKKFQIEIQVLKNRWYVIHHGNIDDYNRQLFAIVLEKDTIAMRALKYFIRQFGGKSPGIIIKRYSEDKVQHEDKVDLVPIQQKWYTDIVKKVYNEKNIEFLGTPHTAMYFRNRAIEDIAPIIAEAIKFTVPVRAVLERIQCVKDVLNYSTVIENFTPEEKEQVEAHLFKCY